ncbi:LemA family protein [Kitasatospora terrestris]|uniref:LemA family protein n=1 Tax=Kitasatospora terrestris TaxID=258051 RepID=A0ABP9DKP1_9ACTN
MGAAVGLVAGIAAVVVVALLVVTVRIHNRLVKLRNQTQASWAQIDVQLGRRHDLIPNLVESTRAYASHERGTIEAVTAARTKALDTAATATTAERAFAEDLLSGSLGRLLALSESYPELKADDRFARLQSELTSAEDKIAYARQFYNSAVQSYNTALETFPANLVAGLGTHQAREYFRTDAAAHGPAEVRFA